MGRPIKQTVEYFSHDANASEGRTLSILFNHFGHEGISSWWLLLERISVTRNHVIAIRNSEEIEYLAAKMHFQPQRLIEILNKMAELDAIDAQLFNAGLIWSQNFVDRLEPVYKKRGLAIPTKPPLQTIAKQLSPTETPNSVAESPVFVAEMQQSKDSKEKERKDNRKDTLSSSKTADEINDIFSLYEINVEQINNGLKAQITKACDEYTPIWVRDAIRNVANKNRDKHNWEYVAGILRNWQKEGHIVGQLPSSAGPLRSDDPDKFVKGKYGHLVRRTLIFEGENGEN